MSSKLKRGAWLGLPLIRFIKLVICLVFIFTLIGCEAFVRKFTRKTKKDKLPREEMVLVPQEYKGPQLSKEEQYRQYYIYWRSWTDELINYLDKKASHKKQIDCAEEVIKNLVNIRALLTDEKQNRIDSYIKQFSALRDAILKDIYGNSVNLNRQSAERIKRKFLREFSYNKIKGYLK
ncbi:hypothetical protein D4R78_00235 [bacterium]|nr:MAG: hypothetical protein D4R78_00235 [bacterium]